MSAKTDAASLTPWTATGLEAQIFVDLSGRRGRRVALGGWLAAFVAAAWFGALLTGAAGFATLPSFSSSLASVRTSHQRAHPRARHVLPHRAVAVAEIRRPAAGL